MSRLITSGDTNLNFGKLLPAPYIEQIYLGTDTTEDLGTIDVQINIYIRSNEYSDDATLLHQLRDLRIVWMYAAPSSTELDELISGEKNIWAYELEVLANWGGANTFQLSEVSDDLEVIYDDEGNRVLKLTYLSSNTGDTLTLDSAWSGIGSDVYLFAWATFDLVDSAYWDSYDFSSGDQIWEDRFGRFLTMETGGVAYEPVWVDKAAATTEEVIWTDEDGNAYDGTPLQSVSSRYYSVNRVTHADIVSSFQDILDAYESLAEDDEPLQDMLDQISYVLVTYGKEADLLPQLNLLRRVFPSKSSVTNVGQLFINYRDAIYNTNTVIEEGDLLSKKEVVNTKVIDLRTTTLTGFSTDDTCFVDSSGDVGDVVTYRNGQISVISNLLLERTSFDYNVGNNQYYNDYGFFFFDYDKALYETSAISQYIDMSLLFDLFGTDMLTSYFQLSKVYLYRKEGSPSDESTDENGDNYATHYHMVTNYENGYSPTPAACPSCDGESMEWVSQNTYPTYGVPYAEGTRGSGDCFAVSFVLLRNFQLASEDGNDDYKMMCFEFQDLLKYDAGLVRGASSSDAVDEYLEGTANRLQFKVNIVDNTFQFLSDISDAYADAISGLETYISDVAGADCVFSTIDGRWVDSFVEEMHAEYDDDLGNAPWNFYPVYYCLYKELFTRDHDGDMTAVLAEANTLSERINPDYGTIDELKAFQIKFDALYTDYFGTDPIATIIDALESADSVERQYYRMFSTDEYITTYAISSDDEDANSICEATAHSMTEWDLSVGEYTSADPEYLVVEKYSNGAETTVPWSSVDDPHTVLRSGDATGALLTSNFAIIYLTGIGTNAFYIDGVELEDGDSVADYITFKKVTYGSYVPGPMTIQAEDEIESTAAEAEIFVRTAQDPDDLSKQVQFVIIPVNELLNWEEMTGPDTIITLYRIESNFGGAVTVYATDGLDYRLEDFTAYVLGVEPGEDPPAEGTDFTS